LPDLQMRTFCESHGKAVYLIHNISGFDDNRIFNHTVVDIYKL